MEARQDAGCLGPANAACEAELTVPTKTKCHGLVSDRAGPGVQGDKVTLYPRGRMIVRPYYPLGWG